jgi:hypothetical protein
MRVGTDSEERTGTALSRLDEYKSGRAPYNSSGALMSRFSYPNLSSQDFEEFVRDLLQAEWNVPLEAFRSGRDAGIDLRYSRPKQGATIIQCKHYVGSSVSTLITHLKNQELPKIRRLAPNRYVLATSQALSPANKSSIKEKLAPYIQSESDILSAGDLDGMLSRHPQVLRENFKLWLTSTEVLDRVVHNAEICHAEYVVEKIRQRIPLYVQGRSFSRAMEILARERVVIISGVPGIGKTTLAEMLLFSFMEQGYEPVVIQAEIAEGRKLYRKDFKQAFYFDDFLGQFFLGDRSDYFGRNQDAALVDFIDMVRHSKEALFILTTREHLLHQALSSSERFSQGRIINARYVLELSSYSFGDRARILYNHVYFSQLPIPYRNELLREDFFLTVIKHPHFNPRLVEWLSTYTRVRMIQPSRYQSFVRDLLTDPKELWVYAFSKQISRQAQDVVLALFSLGESVHIADLDPVWDALHSYKCRKYNWERPVGGLRAALQELEGSFLTYSRSQISFINPSAREFIAGAILSDRDTVSDIFDSAIRFKQVVNLYKLAKSSDTNELKRYIDGSLDRFAGTLKKLMSTESTYWEVGRFGPRGFSVDYDTYSKIAFILETAAAERSEDIGNLAASACSDLASARTGLSMFFPDIPLLRSISSNTWFLERFGTTAYREILDSMLHSLAHANASDWLRLLRFLPKSICWSDADEAILLSAWDSFLANGVEGEMEDCTTSEEFSSLADTLEELSRYGANFDCEVEQLQERARETARDEDRLEEGYEPPYDQERAPERRVTDDDVRQMFRTISDRLVGPAEGDDF